MNLDKRTTRIIILTVIITTVIVIILMTFTAFKGFQYFIDRTINGLAKQVQQQCVDDPIIYRGPVLIPKHHSCYDKKLATILWDIGGAVSSSNCKIIPIPAPFNRTELLMGKDGNGMTMYGQIFWNDTDLKINYCSFIFSGTYHVSQWNENMNINLAPAKKLNNSSKNTQVHGGFLHIYMGIRNQLWNWMNANGRRMEWIIVAGRSLGAALSTICAYDISFQCAKQNIELLHYTFASPRVGNVTFANEFNDRVPHSFRVYNTEDIVVDLPPPIWRHNVYQHVGHLENNRAFTTNVGNLVDNHIKVYEDLPI